METKQHTFTEKTIFYVLVVLSVASIAGLSSCKKSNENSPNNVTVSGIFHGDTVWLNDTIPARIIFSFDELGDGIVNGGIWLIIYPPKGQFERHIYRAKHVLSQWVESDEGNTTISGTCDFEGDLNPIAFSGTVVCNKTIHYIVGGEQFNGSGDAEYGGTYLKTARIIGGTKSTAGTSDCSDYVGRYGIDFGTGVACNSYFNVDPWSIAMAITSSNYYLGGLELSGYLEGNIPTLGQGAHYFMDHSHVVGGCLYINTDDDQFGIFVERWTNPCQPLSFDDYRYGIYIYDDCIAQGGLSMSAQGM